MRVDKLPQIEAAFRSSENQDFNLKPFSLPVSGENNLNLNGIYVGRKDGFTGFYESEKIIKEQIVLHYTIGHIRGDITTLTPPQPSGYPNNKNRLSVAYVIARDGTIYQLFHSSYWAFHLGRGALAGNQTMSKKSIGIELSNFGPLNLSSDGQFLQTIYSQMTGSSGRRLPVDNYCRADDTANYIKLDQPYRGFQYFANYTEKQYQSLIILLRYLTAKHEIPRSFLDEANRYEATESNATFNGIVSHVNHRTTGKTDISKAFQWDKVIQSVQAATYTPVDTDHATGTLSSAAMGGALAAAGLAGVGVVGLSSAGQVGSNGTNFPDEDEMVKAFVPRTRSILPTSDSNPDEIPAEEFMEEAEFDPWSDEMLQ